MGRYVIRRLLQMIPVFFGTTLLIFLMVNVMGDPIAGLCGDRQCDPATAALAAATVEMQVSGPPATGRRDARLPIAV